MENVITIHTDGSCHGNPGPGGYAAILEIPNHNPITVQGGEPHTTNNRMEMLAVIRGLGELTSLANVDGVPINVRTDSAYVVNAFREDWFANWKRNGWRTTKGAPVKNRELWEEMLALTGGLRTNFVHVKGHSGDRMNEECDRIANWEAEAAAGRNAQDQGEAAHEEQAHAAPARNEDRQRFEPVADIAADGAAGEAADGAENGFAAGYEACRQEMAGLIENLGESPHPPTWTYTDGFSDCRDQLRKRAARMASQQPAF
jgi:ribonuclease HI